MTTTLSEGVKVPDVGSVNWAGDLEVNWNLLNGALANLSGNVKLDRDNIWTGEQSFTLPIVGSITGTASKAIADEDGTSIKTGYVNIAGNQTVTGDKTWTGSNAFNNILPNATNTYSLGSSSYQWSSVYAQTYYYNGTQWGLDQYNVWTGRNLYENYALAIKDTRIPNTTAPKSDTLKGVLDVWNDDNHYWGGLAYRWRANGNSELVIALSNWINNAQGYWEYKIGADKAGNQYFTPPHNLVNLGISTSQWKSVHSKTYYYNGTQWGLDQANVWSSEQTILQSTLAQFILKNSSMNLGDAIPANLKTVGSVAFKGSDGFNFGFMDLRDSAQGNTFLRILARQKYDANGNRSTNGTTHESGIDIGVLNDTTPYVAPVYNSTTHLGTSTNKWKTLNGINPGALSLPDVSNSVNIDTTGWVTDGSVWNTITSSKLIDGYLYINYSQCSADDYITVRLRTSSYQNLTFCSVANTTRAGNHYIYAGVPVSKAFYVFLEIKTTGTLQKACIFPCLGNV